MKHMENDKKMKEQTFIIGHKNPDTDSVCSAIAYADFRNITDGGGYIPVTAGPVSEETRFVLDFFGLKIPEILESARTQVCDAQIRKTPMLSREESLLDAWMTMKESDTSNLPVTDENGKLLGMVSTDEIALSYMGINENNTLSQGRTPFANIAKVLNGRIVCGNVNGVFDKGNVYVAAANSDKMWQFISKNDLVITADRVEAHACAVEIGVSCIVVTCGVNVEDEIIRNASAKGITIIETEYDTFTVSMLITQALPVGEVMLKDNLVSFSEEDFLDDVTEVMSKHRRRNFPVLNGKGHYLGLISRRSVLNATGKKVIMVDHNETNQAVEGIEQAQIVEILDHHKIGDIHTIVPVYFFCKPYGCTASIIYQRYRDYDLAIDPKIAGIMCAAIISDTLLFKSPTCTNFDIKVADRLAKIAGIDIEDFAKKMFRAGSTILDKSADVILHQDYKEFEISGKKVGVSQFIVFGGFDDDRIPGLVASMRDYMKNNISSMGMDMLYFLLTDAFSENTLLIAEGQDAYALAAAAFTDSISDADGFEGGIIISGLLSRKKQFIPGIMKAVL